MHLMTALRAEGHDARAVVSGWNDGVYPGLLDEREVPYRTVKVCRRKSGEILGGLGRVAVHSESLAGPHLRLLRPRATRQVPRQTTAIIDRVCEALECKGGRAPFLAIGPCL